jgi:hypothetical protein
MQGPGGSHRGFFSLERPVAVAADGQTTVASKYLCVYRAFRLLMLMSVGRVFGMAGYCAGYFIRVSSGTAYFEGWDCYGVWGIMPEPAVQSVEIE